MFKIISVFFRHLFDKALLFAGFFILSKNILKIIILTVDKQEAWCNIQSSEANKQGENKMSATVSHTNNNIINEMYGNFIVEFTGKMYYVEADIEAGVCGEGWYIDVTKVCLACDTDDRNNDIEIDLVKFANYPDYDNIRDELYDYIYSMKKKMELEYMEVDY